MSTKILIETLKIRDNLLNIRNIRKYEVTQRDIDDYEKNNNFISIIGLVLYFYSITTIGSESGVGGLVLKFIAFHFSCLFIINKLNKHYNLEKIDKNIFKIIAFNSLGFISNIFVSKIFNNCFNGISRINYYTIRHIFIIFAILCVVPLFKEYKRIGNKMRELNH